MAILLLAALGPDDDYAGTHSAYHRFMRKHLEQFMHARGDSVNAALSRMGRARCLLRLGSPWDAAHLYRTAARVLRPTRPLVYALCLGERAECLQKVGKAYTAERTARKAISMLERYPPTADLVHYWLTYAEALADRGKRKRAAVAYQRARDIAGEIGLNGLQLMCSGLWALRLGVGWLERYWVERRWGPYLRVRWREGSRKRMKYIGKVPTP